MEKFTETKHEGWAVNGNIFYPHVVTLTDKLPPGYYEPIYNSTLGYQLKKLEINDKNLINFPNSDLIVKDIKTFWESEPLFRELKFPYKRGILMYGPPGGGKSSTIAQVVNQVISLNGIVMKYIHVSNFLNGMSLVRKIHPTIPIVCLMEDLDKLLEEDDMSSVLNLLDGVEKAVDKIVFLATTNRIEDLNDNIKNRPSRFDRRFKFNPPGAPARKVYFESLFNTKKIDINLNQWVEDTSNFSFAHMKELFTSVILLKNEYQVVLSELKKMQESPGDEEET